MKFKKANKGVLRLNVGGGDRTIGDDEELEGSYWKKFADLGLLVEVVEVVEPAPAKKAPEPIPKPEPELEPKPEPEFEPKPEPELEPAFESKGTMTRSSAEKMAKAQGEKGISTSTKSKSKRRKR